MNKPVELPTAVTGRHQMTPSEAFVETLVIFTLVVVLLIVPQAGA